MLDPRQAYLLTRELSTLLPGVSGSDLRSIQGDFARHIQISRTRGESPQSWQAAWNDFIGPRRQVTYTPSRCPACNGRGFTHRHAARNLSRTGNPMTCAECMGGTRRSPSRQSASATPARLPETPAAPDPLT